MNVGAEVLVAQRPDELPDAGHLTSQPTIFYESDAAEMDAACSTTTDEDLQSNCAKTVRRRQRKCSSDDGIHYVDDDDGVEFQLDQRHLNRVHEELEKLNIATDVINKLELQLDREREKFKELHSQWSKESADIKKKYDSAIKKSRPYYEAVAEERKLREQAQQAAASFERANSMLQVAKQQVKLTQDSLTRQKIIEPECLEVLNHHIQRVNEAEQQRLEAEETHRILSHRLIDVTQRVKQLAKENARSIKKTRHYFDLHMDFRRRLDQQKQKISCLESEVKQKKRDYTSSLRNLEQISDSIHEERSLSSAKHSARTPDSTRKSVSAVGLSKLTADENDSALSDDDIKHCRHQRTESGITGLDSQSLTSASSVSGLSMGFQRDSMISEFCGTLDPTIMFEEEFELREQTTDYNSTSESRRRSGVILLAQRLMGNSHDEHPSPISSGCSDDQDLRYQTKPEGITSAESPIQS
ncbi:unnamed protein product [Bursaphelenchus xylophilus]|uniref:(pine wood nematode) hypothetical protein n=1 Tax=Bursaphelenchus xylophilus TaxID=6326 RepID=A0A1I7RWT0_BURXY|nr:unnamed protein product [Bursaphelenchus xylophilus]CAG9128649.1 unnamed protein product [Bursaphelenchus xylophilus]